MFDLIHFADFWASVGTFFGMCLLTVFVVRYVMQREQLRDQWFMGCLGTITVLLPSAVFQSVGRLSGDAPSAHSSEVSMNSFWLWQFLLVTGIGLTAAALLFRAIPRQRKKALLPAFAAGMLVGLLPAVVPLFW